MSKLSANEVRYILSALDATITAIDALPYEMRVAHQNLYTARSKASVARSLLLETCVVGVEVSQ